VSYGNYDTRDTELDKEVRLYNTGKERELYESLAEIYSIIITLDFVEKAYLRDTITQHEYTPTCLRLLAQYSAILKNEEVSNRFQSLDAFKEQYGMNHAHATSRLKVGVPATVEHALKSNTMAPSSAPSQLTVSAPSSSVSAKAVAKATGDFITAMDGVKLNFRAKDQLHTLLTDLMESLNEVIGDFDGRGKIVEWLIQLNGMKANDEISESQSRQLMFDLEKAYRSFYTTLE
jgi:ESCRT-I complex subunit VPS28